ncbi:MAG: hypothetical protein F4149_17750 [Gammaproteobacteria bacterium]|nr:hypothetical protein [Gammaproteobacteria bacterium]MYK83410.1 hypothetical protein [Gammaproteobacteria bacterium]
MFVGVHGDYHWELRGGELRVSSANPRLGLLKSYPAPTAFNNAEQAQWFVQGRIDMNAEELAAAAKAKSKQAVS